jgi:hypothetical protein
MKGFVCKEDFLPRPLCTKTGDFWVVRYWEASPTGRLWPNNEKPCWQITPSYKARELWDVTRFNPRGALVCKGFFTGDLDSALRVAFKDAMAGNLTVI